MTSEQGLFWRNIFLFHYVFRCFQISYSQVKHEQSNLELKSLTCSECTYFGPENFILQDISLIFWIDFFQLEGTVQKPWLWNFQYPQSNRCMRQQHELHTNLGAPTKALLAVSSGVLLDINQRCEQSKLRTVLSHF